MELGTLKTMFDGGVFCGAVIAPAPLVKGEFNLILQGQNGNTSVVTKARSDDPKNYKTFKSAINDALRIGFKRVTLEFEIMKT